MGGGGYVAGPVGAGGAHAAGCRCADRGGQPPGRREPDARAVRRAGVPRVPDRGAAGREAGSSSAARSRGHRGGRPGRRARAAGRARRRRRCLLVFGGSLGAQRSTTPRSRRSARRRRARVLHASGRRDYDELRARLVELGRRRTTGCSRTSSRSRDALAAADLAVARAGGSVFELAAAGLPAILVPYPHATGDHQDANAALDGARRRRRRDPRRRAEPGRAWPARWAACSAAPQRMAEMANAAHAVARPDAARAGGRRVACVLVA